MTENLTEAARQVLDGVSPTTVLTTDPGSLVSPDSAVRRLHAELPDLGIESPFTDVVSRLTRLDRMRVEAVHLDQETFRRRRALAERLGSGDLDLPAALGELDVLTTAELEPGEPGAAVRLADAAKSVALASLAGVLGAAAGPIFDQLAKAAKEAVASLEALPPPPHNLWISPDPSTLLARASGHETTLSTVANATSRFWRLQHLVGLVRTTAGFGFERFTDGAPRAATVYKQWRKTLDGERELRQTHKSMRLWRTVVDGWQPGCWRPEDIDVPVEDRSFAARLKNLGSAVTGG